MMKNTGRFRQDNQMAALTKEQRQQRREEMDGLHPGYFDRQLKLSVLLGAVLFLRGFSVALSILLGVMSGKNALIGVLRLVISYAWYQLFISGYARLLMGVVFAVSTCDVFSLVILTFRRVFLMQFTGVLWWVTLAFSLLADWLFRAYLLFGKMPRQQLHDNYTIYSGAPISLKKAAEPFGTEPFGAEPSGETPEPSAGEEE